MTHQRHYVIYVPGIRDDLFGLQSFLIQCWRLHGVRPVMFVMPWLGEEGFASKLTRLLSRVDNYRQQGHRVSLVGASAGASAILNAYSQRKGEILSAAYICGKINHPETVSNQLFAQNPAFEASMQQLQATLGSFTHDDRRKFCSFYSPSDTTVPYVDTVIEGVVEKRLPPFDHSLAILYALTFGSGKLLRVLKN